MLTRYFEAAMTHAEYEWADDDRLFVGTIPNLDGVMGLGDTREDAEIELRDVLEGWVILGIRLGHTLPVVDGIDLNIQVPA